MCFVSSDMVKRKTEYEKAKAEFKAVTNSISDEIKKDKEDFKKKKSSYLLER